jgi:hypothetical protein
MRRPTDKRDWGRNSYYPEQPSSQRAQLFSLRSLSATRQSQADLDKIVQNARDSRFCSPCLTTGLLLSVRANLERTGGASLGRVFRIKRCLPKFVNRNISDFVTSPGRTDFQRVARFVKAH